MATPSIQMSKPGGLYRTVQALQWVLSPEVERFSFTVNGVQPTLSKYIAYDTLPGKNPFIAVTQDGAGNVVYDGGFPKFYNLYWNGATTFAGLTAAFKYLHNAMNFCANKKKTEIGNRRILVLGDARSVNNYRMKYGAATDFYTSFMGLAKVAGYSLTIKDHVDYDGDKIDARFNELDQYCCVIVMSSDYPNGNPHITDQCVTDMITYRERGNGLIFITDHGSTSPQQDEAGYSWGFYGTANKVIRNFGAYFTGVFDRTPVNVGFLRATYGDHALYNGMTDAEYIHAGGSESKVVVTQYPEYTAANAPTVNLTQDGKYVISILAILKDGTPETYRYVFNIVLGEFLWWKHNDGRILGDTYSTKLSTSDFLPLITNGDNGTLFGDVLRNGHKLGSFTHEDAVGSTYKWLSGTNVFPVNDKDEFTIAVKEPFSYNKTLTVTRYQPPVAAIIDHAHMLKLLQVDDYVGVQRKKLVNKIIKDISPLFPEYPNLLKNGNAARDIAIIRKYTSEFVGDETTAYIYATTDDAREGMRILTTQPNCIIDAEKNQVWEYQYPEWLLIDDLKAQDFLGAPRRVTSIASGDKFLLRIDGSIVQI